MLARALAGLGLVGCVFSWIAVSFLRRRTVAQLLQLLGAGFLLLVALTHLCEALHLQPGMQWGAPRSAGHYLDLVSALVGIPSSERDSSPSSGTPDYSRPVVGQWACALAIRDTPRGGIMGTPG
jgi:hypothetical protein